MSHDAVALLKAEHQRITTLFDQFEALTPRAVKGMGDNRDRIVVELSQHAAVEERILYPVLIECVPDLELMVLEGMQEHAVAERLLAEVATMDPADRWFRPKMYVLSESVRQHMHEEESEIFPAMRDHFDRAQLIDLADALEQERKVAPTAPPAGAQARALLDALNGRAQEFLHGVGLVSAR